jgi:hypothetical protein
VAPLARTILVVTGLLLIAGILASPLHACSCIPNTVEEDVELSLGVFAGVVLQVEDVPNFDYPNTTELQVRFSVTDSWKGISTAFFTLNTPLDGAVCGFSFTQFEKYVVFVYEGSQLGYPSGVFTHLCTHNQPWEYAGTLLEKLGPPTVVPVRQTTWGLLKASYGGEE